MKFDLIKKTSTLLAVIFSSLSISGVANAQSTFQHVNTGWYVGQGLCLSGQVGSLGSQVNLWTIQSLCQPSSWVVQPDSGGFRLKLSGSNNLCLNAPSSSAVGSLMTLYTCIAGDSGQVFQVTPNPGQLKFKKITIPNAPTCVEPEFGNGINGFYNGHKLRVYPCTNSPNQKFLG